MKEYREEIWRQLTAALDALKADDLNAASKHANAAAILAAQWAPAIPMTQPIKDYRNVK